MEATMEIKPIKTDADYRTALEEIDSLMMVEAETPDGKRLDVLVTLVEAYEKKHFPLGLPAATVNATSVAPAPRARRQRF
jgi:antitoxin component HigA of HigAB toxin-antitoxin module